MKPWMPIALLICGVFVFIYLMSVLGNHIPS